ncbi:probable LRR receptor-like serine/threonine-protein kinase At3g47570 [Camellia sinensis]|uniref:probable LRR receptor-like serine/threonine-protein kinase At3g47570 n=1 Tax=Camellia sinensis TaxID=4442 RepID=UPI0010355A1B|nr:probable LRR receptor-like serine/threonine-protein kinase At3g47570 [Camellia sinensis]
MSKWLTVLCTALVWCCYFCSIPAATSVANNEADRVALLAFKAAIVEDPFGALSSWNHSLYYCHWNGILCSRLHPERVIGLTLMSQGLVGSLSPHIGNLSFLKSIILHNNSFHGPIPQEMGRLFRLQTIEFSYNLFGGGIPNNLSRCSRLERLNFTHNNLTGNIPTELGSLSRLRTLALYTNKISGTIPPSIGNLSSLSYLFTGTIPTSLSNASDLKSIELCANDFSGTMPRDLGKLLGLRIITVHQNRLQDDLSFISSLTNCTSLQVIDAGDNLFRGSLPDSIANLSTYLNMINLPLNQIHGIIPSSIGNLLNLTTLSMEMNNLAGPIPSSIGRLHKLCIMFLHQNKFTELPSSIGNLTSLISLNLGENNIHGSIPPTLGNCHSLLELDLYKNNFNGSIPPEIMSLSSISTSLTLDHNALTGFLPSEIGSLKNLANMDVSYNKLSGPIPNTLSNCLSLEWLYLEANSFEGEIPQSLRMLRGLRMLDLSQNNLSGKIPSYLGELRLDMLNLSFNRLHGEVPIQGVFQNGSAISIVGNNELCGGIAKLDLPPCPPSKSSNKKLSHGMKVILPVVGLLIFLSLFVSFFIFLQRRHVSKKTSSTPSIKHQFFRVSYAELLKATNGFSEANLVGVGSYASVYKGVLDHVQMVVAVKVFNLQTRGASKSFMSECKALRAIRHRNLLKILSICSSVDFHGNEFKALVYEFMANGNLGNWLHQVRVGDHEQLEEPRNLKLIQKLDISTDIASTLEYLHCGCESTIIHGDLKPSNVLLDDEMTAHIGDFGLAKIISAISSDVAHGQSNSVAIRGTIGYVAPEYGMGDMASTLGDVYSFGILLLEMFTGKKPTDDMFKDHLNLHNFVKNALPDRVMEIVDPCILLEHNTKRWIKDCMVFILRIGVACSMESPRDRMEMGSVISELCKIKNTYMNEGLNQD